MRDPNAPNISGSDGALDPSKDYPPGLNAVTFAFFDMDGAYAYDLVVDKATSNMLQLDRIAAKDPMMRGVELKRIPEERLHEVENLLVTMAQWEPDLAVRVCAIQRLGELGSEMAAEVLTQLVKMPMDNPPPASPHAEPDFSVRPLPGTNGFFLACDLLRASAVRSLESCPKPYRLSSKRLVNWLTSKQGPELRRVSRVLLQERLKSEQDPTRVEAFARKLLRKALSQPEGKREDLIDLVRELSPEIAFEYLNMSVEAGGIIPGKAIRALNCINRLLMDSEDGRRAYIDRILATHGNADLRCSAARLAPSSEALIQAISDRSSSVRLNCGSELIARGAMGEAELSLLAEQMYHPKASVRRVASHVLGRIPSVDAALPVLLEFIGDPDHIVRRNVTRAFWSLDVPAPAVFTLHNLVKNGTPAQRHGALLGLIAIGEEARSELLLERLWANVRSEALPLDIRELSFDAFLRVGGAVALIQLRSEQGRLGALPPRIRGKIDRLLSERDWQ